MKRPILVFALLALLLALPLAVASADAFPEVIPLQQGLVPEGITAGTGDTFYVGVLTSGDIFRGDYRSGEVELLVDAPADRIAVGLSFDQRSDLLYVAGAFAGVGYVYDVTDGSDVATISLTAPFAGLINDVTVTRDAVYFTDSFQAALYRVPLAAGGALPDPIQVETIPLGGDFTLVPQPPPPDFLVNANGIVATPDGSWLIIVNAETGELFRVDPHSGYATLIDLGGTAIPGGDGLDLRGQTLYVAQGFFNQIAVVELDPGFTSGSYVTALTSPHFRVPTTIARFGNALYAVNARFDEFDPFNPPPDAEFEAVRVEINH